uniref:S100 calcium binding protein A16 n=1 Tax=Naja naja TaxID=35670 RepID=A0A8C6XRN0_NAJNA
MEAGAKGTDFESAIETLMENYYKYYSEECHTLKRKEGIGKKKFIEMIQKELNHMLTNTHYKECIEEMMKKLDQNKDGVIDFYEYWLLIGNIVNPLVHQKQP